MGASRWRRNTLAIGDQLIVSVTRFSITVLLARQLSAAEFGAFVVCQGLVMLSAGVHLALLGGPLATFGAPLAADLARPYYAAAARLHAAYIPLLAALGAGAALLAGALGGATLLQLTAALLVCSVGQLLQEFPRRVLLSRGRLAAALANDALACAGQLCAVVALGRAAPSPSTALVALGAAALPAALLGYWQCRDLIAQRTDRTAATLREHWQFGRWGLAGVLTQQARSQLMVYLGALLLAPAAVGAIGATRHLLGATHPLLLAMDNVANPAAARRYAGGGIPALQPLLARCRWLAGVAIGGFGAAVACVPELTLATVYGDRYAGEATLVRWFALQYALLALGRSYEYGFKAIRAPQALFFAGAITAAVAICAGPPLILRYGAEGVAAAAALGQAVLLSFLVAAWHHRVRVRHAG